MVEKHPKSKLLEYFAVNKMNVTPKIFYEHIFLKDKNINEFKCRIEIEINENIIKSKSNVHLSKKDAEREAFEKILKKINKKINKEMEIEKIKLKKLKKSDKKKLNYPVLILIDFDNVSQMSEIEKLNQFSEKVESYFKIIKFSGITSGNKKKADICVSSSRKDAVDYYIAFYIGQNIDKLENDTKIFIMTRDKFAGCIADFTNGRVEHVVDYDCLMEKLN